MKNQFNNKDIELEKFTKEIKLEISELINNKKIEFYEEMEIKFRNLIGLYGKKLLMKIKILRK